MTITRATLTLAGLTAAASLVACSGTGGYQSPDYRLAEGSTIELTRSLEVPPNATRVFIQKGVAMRGDAVSQWDPHCSFRLNRSRDAAAREIQATTFTTGETWIGVHAARNTASPTQLAFNGRGAGPGMILARSSDSAGTPWPYTYYTTIALHSEDAPQVDELTCSFDGGPVDRNLTIDQMQATLGEIARIR